MVKLYDTFLWILKHIKEKGKEKLVTLSGDARSYHIELDGIQLEGVPTSQKGQVFDQFFNLILWLEFWETTKLWVSAIIIILRKYPHRASTRLRSQRFDFHLENEPRVRAPIRWSLNKMVPILPAKFLEYNSRGEKSASKKFKAKTIVAKTLMVGAGIS